VGVRVNGVVSGKLNQTVESDTIRETLDNVVGMPVARHFTTRSVEAACRGQLN
jgi:hypothetical protein